jgi:hypothetical protein
MIRVIAEENSRPLRPRGLILEILPGHTGICHSSPRLREVQAGNMRVKPLGCPRERTPFENLLVTASHSA